MTNRIIDENYYESALISYLMKIGTISEPKVNHNNPADYGLTDEKAIKMRISHLRASKRLLEAESGDIKAQYLRGERPEAYITLNSIQERVDKLNRNINFLKARLRGDTTNQPFDLEVIKRVPIESVTKVNANGFFQTNPFRTEKEPSNSLYFYRKTNRWTDFASGRSGDVIDLVMAVNSCSFREACKYLSTM